MDNSPRIYTSYFANVRNLDPEKYCFISIAGKPPAGWKNAKTHPGLELKELAPSFNIWKTWHDQIKEGMDKDSANASYATRFNYEILGKLSPVAVVWNIFEIADYKIPVLLCYEKRGDFCHRHLVADWLNENQSLAKVEEYEKEE